MAIDLILRDLISPASATKPVSMSSIRLLPFQCRLVGKLITYFGLVIVPVSKKNMRPG